MKASRRILKNIASLSIAEVAKNGITLITTAYLARVITSEGFGVLGFATSFISYFVLFTMLGFDTVGAREIANSKDKISKYVNSIFSIRLLLSINVTFWNLFYNYFT